MPADYANLTLEKSPQVNRRRSKPPPRAAQRENPGGHGLALNQSLQVAAHNARQQPGTEDGRFLIKLEYTGSMPVDSLHHHGLEFISQEGKEVCLAFADEEGLARFADHLARLGVTGQNKVTYRNLLLAMERCSHWTEEDRTSWAIQHHGLPATEPFLLDIECWPIESARSPARQQCITKFEQSVRTQQITIVDSVNQNSLLLYRLRCTRAQAKWLLNYRDVRQVDLPPTSSLTYSQLNIPVPEPERIGTPPDNAPRVCVLDSGINANHPLLANAVGETESFVADQGPEDDCGHGTAVAGIVLYGDVDACVVGNEWQPACWLHSGKLMFRNAETGQAEFDEKSIETQIEESVAYFADQCGCRIFNLSLGNTNAPYIGRHIQGIACTLDRLARERDLLFIVSIGNFNGTDTVPEASWRDEYPAYLLMQESSMIDPAPAINALTVGSLARYDAGEQEQRYGQRELNQLSPAGEDQLSPFTRHGPSVGNAIKPELVAHGGNASIAIRHPGRHWKLNERDNLGVLTLNNQFIGSTLLCSMVGTSFAAPNVTHHAARLLAENPNATANFLRAMLVNHAYRPPPAYAPFNQSLHKRVEDELLGYGKIDDDHLYRSGDDYVVMIAEEKITDNQCQFYELPLPEEFLRGSRATRQLRITLAHSPPVRTTRIDYKACRIRFQLVNGTSLEDVQQRFDYERQAAHGTLGETYPGRDISSERRNPGSVQSSVWKRQQLNPKTRWFVVVTRDDPAWGTVLCEEEEPYALVASVTDRENAEARLYTQIQQRLQQRAALRVQNR
jgi:hypothetical protein